MELRLRPACRLNLRARLAYARTLTAGDDEIARRFQTLETSPLFDRLLKSGVITAVAGVPRYSPRRITGHLVRGTPDGVAAALDGCSEEVALMSRMGREVFEEAFLQEEPLSDAERAERCGITTAQAKQLRQLVDRIYVQHEFSDETTVGPAAPAMITVATISIEDGVPVPAYVNVGAWKGRYRVDVRRRDLLLRSVSSADAGALRALLFELDLLEKRNSLLQRSLRVILEVQRDYLLSRNPDTRRPLTQTDLARQLQVAPNVINRLISNKAVEMPWGLALPIRELLSSRKVILRDHVYLMASERPRLTDNEIRVLVARRFGVTLSRQSIWNYRRELHAPRELGSGAFGRSPGSDGR